MTKQCLGCDILGLKALLCSFIALVWTLGFKTHSWYVSLSVCVYMHTAAVIVTDGLYCHNDQINFNKDKLFKKDIR